MLPIAGMHVEASVLARNPMPHRTFKDTAVDKRHGRSRGSWWITSELLSQTTPTSFGFIGSRCRTTATLPHQQTHIIPVHDHDISRHHNAPMIHALLLFPCIQFFVFHICMSSLLLFGLHGSPIQPLWLWSILIRCSTRLVFPKKHPYWMVLMPVYVEMAEGLVKPLVILPAADMPLPSFILIFSRRHRSLCSHWFICSHDPLHPRFTSQIFLTFPIPFVPLSLSSSY